jgi:hypothetical protein
MAEARGTDTSREHDEAGNGNRPNVHILPMENTQQ